ncbi:DUF4112 domain-containing protein [Lyngbya aestuarii]|uniref:DUF4112 domain-containing protein n=1 Tax=Lyngbya aestuarii TaxID=118322 RepID=UPI00403DAE81
MPPLNPRPSNQPLDSRMPTLRRLRQLSHLLDNAIAIPGTPYRIGLDPVLGLLPGGGDILASILSAYIVLEASRLGVPRAMLVQMATNIVLDTVAGSVPVLGDLVDVGWKANAKNVALLEAHLNVSPTRQKVDWLFLVLLLGGLILFVILMAIISLTIVNWLLGVIKL